MKNPLDPGYYGSEELREFGFKAVGENVRISKACNVVGPENIEIGDNVRIDAFTSMIAHTGHIKLGSYIHIGTNCLLGARGGIEFEDFSGLSHGVRVFTATDDLSGEWLPSCSVPEEFTHADVRAVRLCRHTVVGATAVVLPGVTMGEGSILGAMSLARKSLTPWTIHFGSPAKPLCKRKTRVLELEAQVRGVLLAA